MVNWQSSTTRSALLCAILILFLAFLTREIMTAHSFVPNADLSFANFLLAARTPFLLTLFSWLTLLGDTVVVMVLGGVVILSLLFSTFHKSYAIGLATALIGAAASDYVMKMLIGHVRPSGPIPSTIETSFSFPSGHATAALALYGFLAFLLCRLYPRNKTAIIAAAAFIILVVGFSRLYLGVHFPSDVIAGYLLGGLWLLTGIEVTKRITNASITIHE